MPADSLAACGFRVSRGGGVVPPRPTLEAIDLVTPAAFARAARVPASTVRTWIQRAEQIIGRKVEPLGDLGRWPAYDWADLAALEAEMNRRKQERAA